MLYAFRVAEVGLGLFLLFEESAQIDAADSGSGGIKTVAHLDLLAHLGDELGRDVEDFRLTIDEHGDLKLGVQAFAVGAMAIGPAASALPFDKGARQHVAEGAEAADEPAAGLELGVGGHSVI